MGVERMHCCGLGVKNGTVIIGVLESIGAFMVLVLSAAYAENPDELLQMSGTSVHPELTVLKYILIIIAVGSGLQCVFSILLIFAGVTSNPKLLLPWLVLNPIALFVYIIASLLTIIHTASHSTPFFVGHIFFCVITTLIVCYKIMVVLNFYKHLKSLNF